MNKNNVSLHFFFDDPSIKEFYIDILNKFYFEEIESLNLNDSDEIKKLKSDLIIIDISDKKSFLKIKKIEFPKSCKIIIISAFLKKYLILPPSIEKKVYHFFSKPLDFKVFSKVIESCIIQINRYKFLDNKERILVDLVDKSPFKMAIYTLDEKLVYANKDYIDLKGNDYISDNKSFSNLSHSDIKFQEILYNLKNNNTFIYEYEYLSSHYRSFYYFIKNETFVVDICFNITKEKLRIDDLKKSALFFEKSSEGVVVTDKNANILTINTAFSKITGYTRSEVLGKSIKLLSSGIHEKSFYKNLWDNLIYHGKWQGEIWNRRKNGEVYPEWLSITKIKDPNTNEINFMALFTDISSIKEADKKLQFYAKHDHLTGLLNKVQFENILNFSIERAKRNNSKLALMFIDLDHFKEINDTYGHNVGDLVLKTVASRIAKTLRKEDVTARIGGDEFNILIDYIEDESDALEIGNKLNEAIKKDIYLENATFYLSFSIGIAIYPYHGINTKDLIKNADAAMYEVKKSGRDGVLLYNSEFTKKLLKKVELQNRLKEATKNEDFQVFYQPILNLTSNKIIGAEALIRWFDKKENSYISPEKFIPIAENHGMIFDIGKFVRKQAFEDLLLILNNYDENFVMSINVSSREFFQNDYVEDLDTMIKDFSINHKNIELEITETHIMQNSHLAINVLNKLKENNINLAIDDFGSGYSSLNYLKKFPINKLKIDKSFILDMLKDEDDRLITQTIINMSKIFKVKVQAEGVESKAHELALKEMGCDFSQGYYHSKPIPINEFLNLLKEERNEK